MENQYRVGPVYRAGLIVSGGMCAGLGIAILVAMALHRSAEVRLVSASVPTPPTSAVGFIACGLALLGIGVWIPQVTSILAMVSLSMGATLAAERIFGLEPRVETLIAANLGAEYWLTIAPNTVLVLLVSAAALVLRHSRRWSETRLAAIAALGSTAFAIGAVACVGYMTGIPTYVWQSDAPMSFLSAICASLLGLGIVMSACRYCQLDESGMPRWFSLAVWTGALAINAATAVAYFCRGTRMWESEGVLGLMPMIIVSAVLSLVAARSVWWPSAAGRNWFPLHGFVRLPRA